MLRYTMKKIAAFLFMQLICLSLLAQVKLGSLFTDHMVLQRESKVPIWGWAEPSSSLKVKTSWNGEVKQVSTDPNGKWKVYVNTIEAGGPYQIDVENQGEVHSLNNILLGDVWLCSGQSNMEMPLKGYPGQPIENGTEDLLDADNELIRIYTVPRNPALNKQEDSKPSEWKLLNSESAYNFSATAFYFGRQLFDQLEVPIGLLMSSYGGSNIETWMEESWLREVSDVEAPKSEEGLKNKNRIPTMLYNGMIHPIADFGIKGIIWYQGESNYENANEYLERFQRMVKGFRAIWNAPDLPFYYTQIAPFNYAKIAPYHIEDKYNSAYLRDAQRKALDVIPHSGMAVTLDIGEEFCIHPANKKEVGKRLAYLALEGVYGYGKLALKSPSYDSMEIKDGVIEISFKDAPLGVVAKDGKLNNFQIAGENQVFYPADAVIKGKKVLVSSLQVEKPVAVRYGFTDFVVGDLFGVNGLPVGSFRTDNW